MRFGGRKHANQRDANEPEIVEGLRAIGATVCPLNVPCDLLVGYRSLNYLLEVKLPLGPRGGHGGSVLTDDQREFAQTWRGQFNVVRSLHEALEIIGAVKPRPRSAPR